MDTIKKYFIQSVDNDVNKPMDKNDTLSFNNICNKIQDKEASFIIIKDKTTILYC